MVIAYFSSKLWCTCNVSWTSKLINISSQLLITTILAIVIIHSMKIMNFEMPRNMMGEPYHALVTRNQIYNFTLREPHWILQSGGSDTVHCFSVGQCCLGLWPFDPVMGKEYAFGFGWALQNQVEINWNLCNSLQHKILNSGTWW